MSKNLISIPSPPEDIRLDRYIRRIYEGLSQISIQKLLRKGEIRVNGKKCEAGYRLTPSDIITVPAYIENLTQKKEVSSSFSQYSNEEIENFSKCILWEDESICVINKQSGIAVQGGTKTIRHIDGLLRTYKQKQKYSENFKLVHRLDRDTSGVFVVAKNASTAAYLAEQFHNSLVKKTYWAIVEGKVDQQKGIIDAPLAKTFCGNEEKVCISYEGKKSVTHYRTIKKLGAEFTLVECKPLTGRTHQLRVHMSSIDHPIVGDGKYGGKSNNISLCLHAREISFKDNDGFELKFVAPPPPHMIQLLNKFKVDWEQFA